MVGFLDGGVSAAFASMFSGFYLDASLYRPTAFTDDGAGGGADNSFAAAEAVKVQPDQTTQAMRETPGYIDTDRRFLMLADGHADLSTDCELEFDGERFSVFRWSKDPAGAYFDLHVRYKSDVS